MGIHHSPHTHTIPIPMGIPMGIPIPTAALRSTLCIPSTLTTHNFALSLNDLNALSVIDECFDAVRRWFTLNALSLNSDKSEAIVVGRAYWGNIQAREHHTRLLLTFKTLATHQPMHVSPRRHDTCAPANILLYVAGVRTVFGSRAFCVRCPDCLELVTP